jgi:16S rRNA (guanine527-N7)-methyltransferase
VKTSLSAQFQEALSSSPLFHLEAFSAPQIDVFCRYYELILKWNPLLHLTTLTSPREFAERHILESAFAIQYFIPSVQKIMDIGSGCGTPGVPIAILRPDLIVNLVEVNKKKAIFLKEVAGILKLKNLNILNQNFEEMKPISQEYCVMSRALDCLNQTVLNILHLGLSGSQFLLFGNKKLMEVIQSNLPYGWNCLFYLIPKSEHRLLISLIRFT